MPTVPMNPMNDPSDGIPPWWWETPRHSNKTSDVGIRVENPVMSTVTPAPPQPSARFESTDSLPFANIHPMPGLWRFLSDQMAREDATHAKNKNVDRHPAPVRTVSKDPEGDATSMDCDDDDNDASNVTVVDSDDYAEYREDAERTSPYLDPDLVRRAHASHRYDIPRVVSVPSPDVSVRESPERQRGKGVDRGNVRDSPERQRGKVDRGNVRDSPERQRGKVDRGNVSDPPERQRRNVHRGLAVQKHPGKFSRMHGIEHAVEAIERGNATVVKCATCSRRYQVAKSASALFCSDCESVTQLGTPKEAEQEGVTDMEGEGLLQMRPFTW